MAFYSPVGELAVLADVIIASSGKNAIPIFGATTREIKGMRQAVCVDSVGHLTCSIAGDTICGIMEQNRSPCQFPVPLFLNDGTEVGPEVMVEILAALNRQFGGYTVIGVREGCWEGQKEPSMWIEVSVVMGRVPELREVVYAIGKRLGQKVMYFNAPPPTVEFIPIE